MQNLIQDLRYSVRMLSRKPGFALVAVFTLALGIGANSAIFSLVNAVLLRPLPFNQPDQLIKIWETFPNGFGTVSVPNLKDWREQNNAFSGIAAYQNAGYSLQGEHDSERIPAATVSANFFDVLGVSPRLGRSFGPGEDERGQNRIVLLSHALWQRRFNTDPSIVGRTILLGGESYQVIGVMPAQVRFPSRLTEMWVPFDHSPSQQAARGSHSLLALGRLKPGVTFEQAREQMMTIAGRLEQQYKDSQAGRSVRLIPLQEEMVQNVRPALLVMFGAVGLVLLIACVNVANLLLARAAGRRREIAIRAALGAGRGRLIRQFLTESILLSVVGGAVGLVLANWGLSALTTLAGAILPRANEVGLDGRVVGFTLLLSVVTGIVFGLAPALQISRSDVQTALKDSGNAGTSPQRNRLRSLLVVAEISAALVLLIGAGLLLKSFWQLQQTDAGLKPENVITMSISLPAAKYATAQAVDGFYDRLVTQMATLPGVQTAGAINMLPLQQWGYNGPFNVEGAQPYPPGHEPLAELRTVSHDYFQALGIPTVNGRIFNNHDQPNSESVAIINQTLANQFMGGHDAIGKRLSRDGGKTWVKVVGVVADVKQSGLTQAPRSEIFYPTLQVPPANKLGMSLVVRGIGDPTALVTALRNEVRLIDPSQPIHNIKTMEAVISESVADRRLNMVLLGLFAAVALILAMIGIYSVISYTVTQSTREIGIRVALGAQSRHVLKLVLGKGLVLALAGVVIGVAGAFGLTRLLANLLFGVTATDPFVFASVPVLLVLTALLASYLPARRAMKLDPIKALRNE